MEITFGEQIKILLNRNHMTIQELADRYESATGNKMSRQNLTQRLKRDNFPEQDMRILAALLGCRVSIQLDPVVAVPFPEYSPTVSSESASQLLSPGGLPFCQNLISGNTGFSETDSADFLNEADEVPDVSPISEKELSPPIEIPELSSADESEEPSFEIPENFRRQKPQGDINPMTGCEYLTNTVRKHPSKSGYIQVYDQKAHAWSDVRENYFWEFQEKKKQILGKDYQEPILI